MQKPNQRPFSMGDIPLNTKRSEILQEVAHLKLIPEAPNKWEVDAILGNDSGAWCNYHRLRGHHTDDCLQLKKAIEKLIQKGHLSTYVQEGKTSAGKRDTSRKDLDPEEPSHKRGKGTEEVH